MHPAGSARHGVQSPEYSLSASIVCAETKPFTPVQLESNRQMSIDFIDQDAIRALASRHNGMKRCHILDSANSSFNVRFFAEFLDDHTKWVMSPLPNMSFMILGLGLKVKSSRWVN